MSEVKPRLWHGPIASEAQARSIIAWASWPLILLSLPAGWQGVSAFLRGLIRHGGGSIFGLSIQLVPFILLFAPSFLLLRTRSVAAAFAVLAITSFAAILGVGVSIHMAAMGSRMAVPLVVFALFSLAFVMQAWRALQAVKALPRLKTMEVFSEDD